jgi:hypothetical protein
MANFITIPTTGTGYATTTYANGGPIQLPVALIFDIKQTAATTTAIYFDNRLGAGQKILTLFHTTTAAAGTDAVVAKAIYAAMAAAPGGVFVPVSLPTINGVQIVITGATYS